jgi:hypothetical protein
VAVSGQTLSFTATIATDATPGKRSLVVTYPDCTQAELKDLVEIKPAARSHGFPWPRPACAEE